MRIFNFLRRSRTEARFTWQPALDMSDKRAVAALLSYCGN